jgi:hypothetical protein
MAETVLMHTSALHKNEVVFYHGNESTVRVEVRIDNDSVWLNRHQIAVLFNRDVKTIGKHINKIFAEQELDDRVVVAKFAITTEHGALKGKTQTLKVDYYNLDVIISVGYRVKSREGTLFRIWAMKVLRDYLTRGYAIHTWRHEIESNVRGMNERIEQIEMALRTNILPSHGVFFDGQVFDAFVFFSNVISSANRSIVLIDNYIDHTVLLQLAKRREGVTAVIYTAGISASLRLDLEKHNAQYPPIEIRRIQQVHDRFLLIDGKELYHIGASIKDLGKKWFAFSRMDSLTPSVLEKLPL